MKLVREAKNPAGVLFGISQQGWDYPAPRPTRLTAVEAVAAADRPLSAEPRLLALQLAPAGFARMSVALSRTAAGIQWHFRVYGDSDIIAKITVSADGRRVIDRPRR